MSRIRSCLGQDFIAFFQTEDGGRSWLYQERDNLKFEDVFFINTDTAFAIRDKYLFRSNDQGKNWRVVSIGNCNYPTRTLYQINDSILHIVTSNSFFVYNFYNQDRIQFSLPRGSIHFSGAKTIRFYNETLGFQIARDRVFKISGGVILCAGVITKEGEIKSKLNSLFIIDPNNIWVVGQNGFIAKLKLLPQ